MDIVTYIRAAAGNKALDIGTAWNVLEKAADEIERLRAQRNVDYEIIEEQRTEIEQLRAMKKPAGMQKKDIDIIERLRSYAHPNSWAKDCRELTEAADEIEKLRDAMQTMANDIVRLRAEIGRLRTAVRVNGLRAGFSDAEIDAVLDSDAGLPTAEDVHGILRCEARK